ncbi:MAG: YncE family protein, partial [Acidimicrobiales bacterium]
MARASVVEAVPPASVIRDGAPASPTGAVTGASIGSGLSLSEPLPGSDRMPNGWGLHPAGTQVLTNRGTTGVVVSPDGKSIYATTSGIFEEAVVHIDAATLLPTPTLASDTYQGVLADAAGNVWVSGGPANAVWQYKAVGPALVDVRQAGVVPDTPNRGIPVTGYPGNMVMAGPWLAVAGNLSVPNSVVTSASRGGSCAQSDICSVINLVDASNPDAMSPPVHAIPVGRDAYGLAYRSARGTAPDTLYVSNFADQTNPRRSGGAGVGTVSVVSLDRATGTGTETQVLPVGMGPAGLALSPDGRTVVTADSGSDQLSVLAVNPATAKLSPSQVVSVAAPRSPLGTTPVGVAFSPDGKYLYVTLAGLNAVEVFAVSNGKVAALPQKVRASFEGRTHVVGVPGTYIPTGWYPDAMAVGPEPSGHGQRLYVANLRGEGSGPGFYGQVEPLVGSSTEGSVSAIDLPIGAKGLAGALQHWTAQVVNNDQLGPLYSQSFQDPATNACLAAPLPNGSTAHSDLICKASKGVLNPKDHHVVIIDAE